MNQCYICSRNSEFFSSAIILEKYSVHFYRCPHCGFITTEKPYWLDDAYNVAIADTDVGLICRNINYHKKLNLIIKACFPCVKKILDYGGGYGILVRMMRDSGFDYFWHDKYCKNLFAKGFEHKENSAYDLCTAIELMEHLHNPLPDVKRILNCAPNLIFTTSTVPYPPPLPDEWPYYSLETGQHLSFYTQQSLTIMAKTLGLFYCNKGDIHIFSEKKISPSFLRMVLHYPKIINFIFKKESLLQNDYLQAKMKITKQLYKDK